MKRIIAVAAMAPLMAFPAVAQDNGAAARMSDDE